MYDSFQRLLDKSVLFEGDRALPIWYHLRVNPPKKASGFAGAIGKHALKLARGTEERWGMHLMWNRLPAPGEVKSEHGF